MRAIMSGDKRYVVADDCKLKQIFGNDFPQDLLDGKVLKYNQLVPNGNFESNANWNYERKTMSVSFSNNESVITALVDNLTGDLSTLYQNNVINGRSGHKLLVSFDAEVKDWNGSVISNFVFGYQGFGVSTVYLPHDSSLSKHKYQSIITANINASYKNNTYVQVANARLGMKWAFSNIMCADLTDMFGSGNEPATIEEFYATPQGKLYQNGYVEYGYHELKLNKMIIGD